MQLKAAVAGLAALVVAIAGPALAQKRIALSFDDAPRGDGAVLTGDDRTTQLIEALAKADAGPTAIFVTPRNFPAGQNGRARIERFAAAGHLIANHTNTHPWLSRTELDVYLADLDKAAELIKDFDNTRPWFRFPFLDEERNDVAKRDAMRAALDERGLFSAYVTVDTYDWHIAGRWVEAARAGVEVDRNALRDVYVAMIVDAAEHYAELSEIWLGRQPAHVLLLHENDPAAFFIGDALAALRAEGWEIISPDEAYADPIAKQLPETRFSGMGRVSALAFDAGARGAGVFNHWSVDEAAIDKRLAEAGAIPLPDPN